MNFRLFSVKSQGDLNITLSRARRLRWALVAVAALIGLALTVWIVAFDGRFVGSKSDSSKTKPSKPEPLVSVEVVAPKMGGIDRICVQPGTIEPFESADLYAKVSGFLIESVDIGLRVEQNQVLAQLAVPELDKQVVRDAALVEQAKAKLTQMEAHKLTAQAEARAAAQMIIQANVEFKSKSAYRSFRSKQLERIKSLYRDNAVEAKLVDEETDRYEAAFEAENAAKEGVETARLKSEAAKAKIAQADADIDNGKAEIKVAEAELERARVLQGYAIIRSPYDGVVTKRNFFRGDFIRSADAGGDRVPIVAVDRTDWMRMIVQVPDRDVPYVDKGDIASIEIDALPGKSLEGQVSRAAHAEDQQTRAMRTEIDIPNLDGRLRRNMYGRVRLLLQPGLPSAFRVSTPALLRIGPDRQPTVRAVRDGRVRFVPVAVGIDNGVEVEILSGVRSSDRIIVASSGPLEDGVEVTVTEVTSSPPRH